MQEDLRADSRANVISVSQPSVRTRSSSTVSSSTLDAVAVRRNTSISLCIETRHITVNRMVRNSERGYSQVI